MTHVFGDIHGCCKSLDTLLELLAPGPEDIVVTLGDYVDRGPDSKGVFDRLIQLQEETTLVALKGNHELMMEDARQGPPASSFWLLNGGIETLESYNGRTLNNVPDEHWEFIANLKPYHIIGDYLLTHATPPAEQKIEDFGDEELYWGRFREPMMRHDGKFLICGHTPQDNRRPTYHDGNICLDTGCVHEGYLTAYTLETGIYVQANEEGDLRDGIIDLGISEAAA